MAQRGDGEFSLLLPRVKDFVLLFYMGAVVVLQEITLKGFPTYTHSCEVEVGAVLC